MTSQHPITPPPEMVEKWVSEIWHEGTPVRVAASDIHIATEAARWGADQELETILEMVGVGQQSLPEEDRYLDGFTVASIRAARRPKPPSLKQSALHELNDVYNRDKIDDSTYDTIRRALEQL